MSHIVLRTHDGILLTEIENVIEWDFARTTNDLGWFTVRLTDIDPRLLSTDNILEFYRTPSGSPPILLGVGFLRYWEWVELEDGSASIRLGGPDQMDLAARRVVAYNDPEANWHKDGPADDLIKAVIRENMGTLATDPWYNRGRSYPADHFIVAPDESKGRDIEKQFQYRNTLEVIREMADASGWPSEDDDFIGLPVFFDCIYVGPARFEFRTWSPLRGVDRTIGTQVAPLIFSKEAGNLSSPVLRFDYAEEQNIIYGLGTGDGTSRMVDPENDVPRENLSIWNLHEGIVPATEETTILGVAIRAFNRMQERRPRVYFQGNLLDTPQTRFGVDWGYGDVVSIRYRGQEFDGRVDKFYVHVDSLGGEVLTAQVSITKALEGKPD